MICTKCGGRGFIEKEHGLLMELCDCEKGRAKRVEVMGECGIVPPKEVSIGGGIPKGMEIPESEITTSVAEYVEVATVDEDEITDDSLEPHTGGLSIESGTGIEKIGSEGEYEWEATFDDRSNSGVEPNNLPPRSGDTGEPKRTRQPKSKKKAARRPR